MGIFQNKKLLVLGGKTLGSYEIVERAKGKGIYTIVTDYLSVEESKAKQIADEVWNISTADIETLAKKVKECGVDGIVAGVNEFNIVKSIQICELLGLPCYCDTEQWNVLQNKSRFKDLCRRFEIPVTREYYVERYSDLDTLPDDIYPVIVKPSDGSSSRGFSICTDVETLKIAYMHAMKFSESGKVLIENLMNYKESVIINYTIMEGKIYYCGMSDKYSRKVADDGAPIMALQFYPSLSEEIYLNELNSKVVSMLSSLGLRAGVIWIEAFNNNGKFTFNELGFRFGGSLTYYPVEYFYKVNQLDLQIEYAVNGKNNTNIIIERENCKGVYCIFPVQLRPGVISKIIGIDELKNMKEIKAIVTLHNCGAIIENWGSAQQVFSYIHFVVDSRKNADEFIKKILSILHVLDVNGEEMLFNLYYKNDK